MIRDLVREACALVALGMFVAFIAAGGTLAQHLRGGSASTVVAEAR